MNNLRNTLEPERKSVICQAFWSCSISKYHLMMEFYRLIDLFQHKIQSLDALNMMKLRQSKAINELKFYLESAYHLIRFYEQDSLEFNENRLIPFYQSSQLIRDVCTYDKFKSLNFLK